MLNSNKSITPFGPKTILVRHVGKESFINSSRRGLVLDRKNFEKKVASFLIIIIIIIIVTTAHCLGLMRIKFSQL